MYKTGTPRGHVKQIQEVPVCKSQLGRESIWLINLLLGIEPSITFSAIRLLPLDVLPSLITPVLYNTSNFFPAYSAASVTLEHRDLIVGSGRVN